MTIFLGMPPTYAGPLGSVNCNSDGAAQPPKSRGLARNVKNCIGVFGISLQRLLPSVRMEPKENLSKRIREFLAR